MKYMKPALTYEQQAELLTSRGMQVSDRDLMLHWLQRVGYFRLSAYILPFKIAGTETYKTGCSFDRVLDFYKFDAKLRILVMQAIDRMEVSVRASVTYHMAHTLGPFGYIDPNNFTPFVPSLGPRIRSRGFDHANFMANLGNEIGRTTEAFVLHYIQKYTSEPHLPIWMATEIMTCGWLSRMTEGLRKSLRKKIAQDFRLSQSQLTSWLESLTYVRNICAHHARLWDRELSVKPELLREWKLEGVSNTHVYCILLVLHHILDNVEPNSRWKDGLMQHLLDHPEIDLKRMGFSDGWQCKTPWNISSR